MKGNKAHYEGRVKSNGHYSCHILIPAEVMTRLGLRPNEPVRVTLQRIEGGDNE